MSEGFNTAKVCSSTGNIRDVGAEITWLGLIREMRFHRQRIYRKKSL